MSEKRVMVVDDEKQIRDMYSLAFARAGYASLFKLSDCRDAGFEDYFTKPASLADLLETADQACKKIARWKKR